VSGTFKDGGSVNGTITLDVYGYVTAYDLTTTANGSFAAFDYKPSNSYFDNGGFYFDASPGWFGDLHLSFLDNLTTWNGPGPDPLTGSSYQCVGSWDCGPGGLSAPASDVRFAVPEPATWALLMVGFGLIGAGLRFTRKAQAVTANLAR
jgi:hypothetical protein